MLQCVGVNRMNRTLDNLDYEASIDTMAKRFKEKITQN